MLFGAKNFQRQNPLLEKNLVKKQQIIRLQQRKFTKLKILNFKDADPLNFPLWFSIIEFFL